MTQLKITRLADDGDYSVATNGEITIRIDFVRPGTSVQWLEDAAEEPATWFLPEMKPKRKWKDTPFQSVKFSSVEQATQRVYDWMLDMSMC